MTSQFSINQKQAGFVTKLSGLSSGILRQIATELFISASTVHTHTQHVYEKAGVSTRGAVALFAMEHDLVRV